ncbi:M48 family metallopeptidase [Streptomyces sp. NPDC088785]|uniref:M48 family metallopeptidase n=1 Tax=Streptomyces sp. NPDC088785 TaxID=3365897 RepID=UPI00380EB852
MTVRSTETGRGQRCPDCDAALPADEQYVAWCAACDWNVDPGAPDPVPGRAEALRRRLARRYGERLFAAMDEPARRDPSGVLAVVVALAVHTVSAGLAVAGLLLLVLGWGHGALPVIGALLLVLGCTLRPRFGRLPADAPVLRRPDAPRLFALIDEIAAAAGTTGVDVIVLGPDAGAHVTTYGIRHRRLLHLGLTLWEILTPQERVALLGHELGHFAHGDLRHTAVVARALDTLALWLYFLAPGSAPGLAQWFANVVMAPPRWIARGLLSGLDRLTLRASQRAEYLADGTAARVGSSAAAAGLLDRLLVTPSADNARRREAIVASRSSGSAARREAEEHLWERVAACVALVPEVEYERLRRVGVRRGHAADSTHPPTHLRHRRVTEGVQHEASVHCDTERTAAIAAELAAVRRRLAQTAVGDAGR